MTDKNISNDLNYLLNLIRFLSDTLDMNLNFSVFREKTVSDIFYLNTSIRKIEINFTESDFSRNEYLMHLKRIKSVKDNYVILLENIVRGEYLQSENLFSFFQDFTRIAGDHKTSSRQIQEKLSRKNSFMHNDTQISKEELKHLFTPGDGV